MLTVEELAAVLHNAEAQGNLKKAGRGAFGEVVKVPVSGTQFAIKLRTKMVWPVHLQ